MMPDTTQNGEKLAKTTQQQAVAAWVHHLNQLRIDGLLSILNRQQVNLQDALASVDAAISTIDLEVVATNQGGVKGMHGFIAEVAEAGVGNARNRILGAGDVYQWVNDNGPVDLMRAGLPIQQKFVAAGGRLGLGAIAEHLRAYPDFIGNGGRYQIPRDHFEVIQRLHDLRPDEAGALLSRGGAGPSFRDWQRVQTFFAEGSVTIESLEPSNLDYSEVQRGAYSATLDAEKSSLREADDALRNIAHRDSLPTIREGATAALAAAVIEGGTTFVLAVVAKRRAGTKLRDFTAADWHDIADATGFGVVTGGVRGLSVYSLTNFSLTSASVASSIVTAAFGIAEQANSLRHGEIDERQFIERAELVALEAAVSALSSLVGQALIPIPVLGAVLGNTVGVVMYKAVSSSLSAREAQLIARYLDEQRTLDDQLAADYQQLVDRLDQSMAGFLDVLEQAFSPDLAASIRGSVDLARHLGVAPAEILDTDEAARAYFLD